MPKKSELKFKDCVGKFAVLSTSVSNKAGVSARAGDVVKIVATHRGSFTIQTAPWNEDYTYKSPRVSKIPRAWLRRIGEPFPVPPEEVHVIASTSDGHAGGVMASPFPEQPTDGYRLHSVRYVRGDVYDALKDKLDAQQAMGD